jgi:hypothetical protein
MLDGAVAGMAPRTSNFARTLVKSIICENKVFKWA